LVFKHARGKSCYEVIQSGLLGKLNGSRSLTSRQPPSKLRNFVSPPFGAILKHNVHSDPSSQILRDPIHNSLRAALKVFWQNQNSDQEFSVFLAVEMVSGAGFPVTWRVRESLGAFVGAVLEVEKIDICKSC